MSLILRAFGAAGLAGFAGVAAASVFLPNSVTMIDAAARQKTEATGFAPLPGADAHAPVLILEMSPFAKDRSPFDRATASAPPPPPVEVKLTGIFRVGNELRASLLINGQSIAVRKGDETAAGKVTHIESGAVVISGTTERRLEMFK